MHGAGFILDSINRMKSNRSLTQKDRGAFNIQEKNRSFKKLNIKARYKQATPEYMAKLRSELRLERARDKRLFLLRICIVGLVFLGLIYMAFAFTF